MLDQLLPPRIDNTFRGYRPALWILGLLLVVRTLMSVNSIVNAAGVAASADGIPLASFPPAAAQTVIALFALSAFARLATTLLGALALVRYRAMVPLVFALFLFEHLGRMAVLGAMPIPRAGDPPASAIGFILLGLVVAGLVVSLRHARPAA